MRLLRLLRVLPPLLAALSLTALSPDAKACGGGVFVSWDPAAGPTPVVVSGHRIAIAISDVQTVAWSQIHYQGAPSEFAWVVPVIKDTKVQLADEAFLEAIDAFTTTQIVPNALCPHVDSGSSGGGCSCLPVMGSSGGANGDDLAAPPPKVTIEQQASIGPYETVTLSSPDGDSVRQWLVDHGYPVSAEMLPVMKDYATKGLSFAALRLKADAKTEDMKPVRLVMPARVELTAIRMMLAGTADKVPITLFVISDAMYAPTNFPQVNVDRALLEWDYAASTSNYQTLRQSALAQGAGNGWLATYAGEPFAHLSAGKITVADAAPKPWKLDDLYFALAAARAKKPDPCATRAAPYDACDGHDDLAVLTRGIASPQLVRLELNLPRAAFASDLDLQKTSAFGSFSSSAPFALQVLVPGVNKNVPCADYRLGDGGTLAQGTSTTHTQLASAWLLALSLPLVGGLRRALRRGRRAA